MINSFPVVISKTLDTTSSPNLRATETPYLEEKGILDYTHKPLILPPRAYVLSQRSNDSLSTSSTLMPEKRVCQLPLKRHGRLWRNLRFTLLSVYRRLFTLIFIGNIGAFIYLMVRYKSFFAIPHASLSTAVASNLFTAVLMRQELTINMLFTVFGLCPQWVPLRIRRLIAKIYHFGGIHSGCGVAATMWFTMFHVSFARSAIVNPSKFGTQPAALALTAIIDCLLLAIVITAYPRFRILFHNMFENIHRFAGWTAVILFWAQLVVLMDFERHGMAPMPSLSSLLVRNPSFWLLIAISLFLIGPWLQLKKVNVHPEYLSNHAIRLHFTYANLSLCTALRFSTSPLREWHAFAGIPAKSGQGFSVVVSHAGDWTKSMISDPPTHLWTRGFPTKGVLNIAPVFKSVVLVATGSGIGPILSLITARNIPCRIVWSTPTPQTTYQQEIVDDVYRADPQAIIIDTTRFGRPDLVHVSYEAFNDFGAEAVFIISNPKVTRKVVYGLESRGVPIFAPIFDS